MKGLNIKIKADILKLVDELSVKEEDRKKLHNTLVRLSNDKIECIKQINEDKYRVKIISGILKRLNGHKQSDKIMEYVLCFEGRLLSALQYLFYNEIFLSSKHCLDIVSGLCFARTTDNQLLHIIIELNNTFIILNENKNNLVLDINGYMSFIAEFVIEADLQLLYDLQMQLYEEIENNSFVKKINYSKNS